MIAVCCGVRSRSEAVGEDRNPGISGECVVADSLGDRLRGFLVWGLLGTVVPVRRS